MVAVMMLELSFIIFKCQVQLAENRLCGMCCLRAEHELRLIRLTVRGICHAFHVCVQVHRIGHDYQA